MTVPQLMKRSEGFFRLAPESDTRGVVLFQDINVREREFGVCRFWKRLRPLQTMVVHSYAWLAYVGTDLRLSVRTLLAPRSDSVSRIVHISPGSARQSSTGLHAAG